MRSTNVNFLSIFTDSCTVANNFWGKDDAGVGPMLERMHNAKVTGDELKSFYTTRAQIEEEYARKLLNLARKPLGSCESGTLRMSLDVVRGEVESMGKQHQNIAGQMKSELEEPMAAFTGAMKERRKIVQGGVEKLLKTKNGQTAAVNKSRDRYEQDCLKIKGYLAQGHMVMGQEERKNKAKLEKTQIQMSTNSNEYEEAVKVLEETTGKWNREWKGACDRFQDLEEERIDYMKSSLWSFANIASTVCVSDDASCEKIRLSLEDCDVEKDITQFIKDIGTGQEIPDPPKYINFCRGDADDAASAHGSEDDNYAVAQFPRTINPTFRSSSPQPSTLGSHHDPDSALREEMGLPKGRSSLQGEEGFNARSSYGSAAPPPLAPSQTSAVPNPYGDIPQVPHNPNPPDGMTQFCRLPPPSERSSNPSPTRPDSRDSLDHSDYSNPTSYSSFDPNSGHASPTKQFNGSNMSGASSGGDDRTIQKKKSGFFNSPFRRRSQKLKDAPSQSTSATPTTRNTWTPATTRCANTSPTKPPFGAGNRANTWQKQSSPDPAVDPRAEGYQLGIGNNVFDVDSPDSRKPPPPKKDARHELDPIAAALAELKGVGKQASVRTSADRHYGMSTPAPPASPGVDGRGMPAGAVPTPFAQSSRSTPPPAYDQPMSRLGAPQPAHTSKEMQRTTERFVNQNRNMFNSGGPNRPGSSAAQSSGPPRATSPRPFVNNDQRQQPYRAPSPNPYGDSGGRPRAQSNSPMKPQPNYGGYNSRGGSPGYQPPRAVSPNPAYSRSAGQGGQSRPGSSRGDDGGMALQLAPAGGQDPYAAGSQRGGRPQSQYYGENNTYGSAQVASRTRSQSVGAQRQVTKDGRPVLHYGKPVQFTRSTSNQNSLLMFRFAARAMYMYAGAIPEELSFAKGDILAVTRHQDDGWWEAEVAGKNGPTGLVPSNYLKNC